MLRLPLPKLAPAAFRTMSTGAPTYKLYYHPTLPGRGEYVRLAFEASGTSFADAANAAVYDLLKDTHPTPHFAPPILGVQRAGAEKEFTLSQTPAILAFLGPRLGLVGDVKGEDEVEREERRARVNQLMLTALDFMVEAHDTHHPIANSLYYEDQQAEATRRAALFRKERVPKFFAHFERALAANGGAGFLVGTSLTTADLTLFQTLQGMRFAFPRRVGALYQTGKYPALATFEDVVAQDPRLKAYLASERRRPFSSGLFRAYKELDGEE